MNKKAEWNLSENPIGVAAQFVEKCLKEYGLDNKAAMKGTLIAEEAIASMVAHASDKGAIKVNVKKILGSITVELSAPGSYYDLSKEMANANIDADADSSEDALAVIRNILLRTLADDLKYNYKNGYNYIQIVIEKSKKKFLYFTLASLIVGAVLGLLLSMFAPKAVSTVIDGYIFSPVKIMYLNALKIIVAPVVFFSIVTSLSGFTDLSELGKIGGRTLYMYMFTTIIAVIVGIISFFILKPGGEGLTALMSNAAETTNAMKTNVSFLNMIIDIVPSNFLWPFLNNTMPQLIFIAVLCGISVGLIGKYSEILKSLFEALNELFKVIMGMIIKFMPIAVFCSTASMMISLGIDMLLSILGMFGTFIFGILCMLIVYCLLMLIIGKLNPIHFIRKYSPYMLQIFSLASSNAAIPLNMEACGEKLGVNGKVYNLSIPLGATINMDGMCIQLMVFALAIANAYGVQITGSNLLMLAFTVIILTVGAPGMPGAGIICLTVLLEQLNIPTEVVSLFMGIGPLLGMFLCMCNCTGDAVVTTIVAKSVGELNIDQYTK